MTARRAQAQEPPPALNALMTQAVADGKPRYMGSARVYPPTAKRATWRVVYRAPGRRELSGGRTAASLWAAVTLAEAEARRESLPHEEHTVAEMVAECVRRHQSTGKWGERTVGDRRRDLGFLLRVDGVAGLACRDLAVEHLRAAVARAGTAQRGKFITARLAELLRWGRRNDYLSSDQVGLIDRVEWVPPVGYEAPGKVRGSTRRAGTDADAVPREDVLGHNQVNTLATALAPRYRHGALLVHLAAATGLRGGEILCLTAAADVADSGNGSLVDLDAWLVRVRWQLGEQGGHHLLLPKGDKVRDVVIPVQARLATGFDLRTALDDRVAAARQEQAAGANPRALLFPAARGGWLWKGQLEDRWRAAMTDLDWPSTTVTDANGCTRTYWKYTLHSLRDRYAVTAVDEWHFTRSMLYAQGGWEDMATVERYYYGVTDDTHSQVVELLGGNSSSEQLLLRYAESHAKGASVTA
ncbi:MAG: hypothetical protein R2737_17155 [Candidatus Nanopelagicales bacterium]